MDRNYDIKKIICLTEESVETLYLLGKESLIVGVSSFVKRPPEAQKLDKVSLFTSSNYKKILQRTPDLILGHSDIQKNIAKDLIELGQNVYIANHRTIDGILDYIVLLSSMVNAREEGIKLVKRLEGKISEARAFASKLDKRPKVYFEEWDDPKITAIGWVSELIELCGGICITKNYSTELLAMDRVVQDSEVIEANPDIIFGCWCGKKVKIDTICKREGWEEIQAIKNGQVYELDPSIFLQPGPAPILSGIEILISYFKSLEASLQE